MKRADTHHNDQPATTSEDELVHEATEPTRIDVQPTDIMTGSPEQIRAQNGHSVVLDADVEPSEEPGNIVAAPVVPTAYAVAEEDEAPVEIAQAEKVKPFLQRKEGQVTIVVVGVLLACVAVLLVIFLTQGRDNTTEPAPVLIEAPPTSPPTFDPRPTLAIVQERGKVNCGVEDLPVFKEGVNLYGFNLDQCRAIAATIFGDPSKINLVVVDAKNKYEKLFGRDVDVLIAGDVNTLEKQIREEPTTGETLKLGYQYYSSEVVYFGLEAYVKCASEQKRFDECADISICAVDTAEIRRLIISFFPSSFVKFGSFSEMEVSLNNGTCNVLVCDQYRIFTTQLQYFFANGTYVVSDNHISRNIVSSVVRNDDENWSFIVDGTIALAHRATQVGIGKNDRKCPNSTKDGTFSFYNVPWCVGNSFDNFMNHLSYVIISFGGLIKLPTIDAPNFGSLDCDDCKDVLKYGRLKQIKERGHFNCAVYLDPTRNLTMTSLPTLVNMKFCEMMAVAIFQGDPNAVKIIYIDKLEYSAIPPQFDVVAGVTKEPRFDSKETLILGKTLSTLPYYSHDQYRYNGTMYNGTGDSMVIVTHNADVSLKNMANAIIAAAVYSQRQGITSINSNEMPLIHLFGDSLTFMLRDVVSYGGNYDDIISEALALSDGAVDRGWNIVVPNQNPSSKVPVYYCDYTDSCPPCEWVPEGYCIAYTFDTTDVELSEDGQLQWAGSRRLHLPRMPKRFRSGWKGALNKLTTDLDNGTISVV